MPDTTDEIEEFDDKADHEAKKAEKAAANEEHLRVRSGEDPR